MLLIPGLLPVFSTYQLYQQIKDMKIWQQVLAQQMKPLISPILMILTPWKPLHSQDVLSHQRGFWIETPFQMQKTKALSQLFPECVRKVEKYKAGRFLFLGCMLRKYQGESLRLDSPCPSGLCLMTLSRVGFLTLAPSKKFLIVYKGTLYYLFYDQSIRSGASSCISIS